MSDEPRVIRLPDQVIDLVEEYRPTLTDVARSSAIRRAGVRALHDLEANHPNTAWAVVCTDTEELIAASPSFDSSVIPDLRARFERAPRWDTDDAPLALLHVGDCELPSDHPAAAAAALVIRALGSIVVAEHRAEEAVARAGRAEALAATDALTGLGNQRAWWDRVAAEDARIGRSDRPAVVAVIDLDDLKRVNDARGHLHGDLLLRLTAQTLRAAVRSCDVVARVGGDEFAVLAVDFEGPPPVLAGRVSEALAAAGISASVGVAAPSPGVSLIDAYHRADQAMYRRKLGRRGAAGQGAERH